MTRPPVPAGRGFSALRSLTLALALGSLALVPTPRGLAAQEGTPAGPLGYALRPGDRVSVQLYTGAGVEVTVVDGERTIDQNGNLFLPYVGSLPVAGLDHEGLRAILEERYGALYSEPVIDLAVRLRVNITGSVGIPGQYYVEPTTTLIDAIATARGMSAEYLGAGQFGAEADPTQVRLVRHDETVILNLRPEEVTDEVLRMRVQSGDWIHVPPRPRSRIRDDVQFWGSIVSFVTNIVFLVVLAN